MTITGAGARNTIIDANGLSRVFSVTSDERQVSISGLTLTGGLSSFPREPRQRRQLQRRRRRHPHLRRAHAHRCHRQRQRGRARRRRDLRRADRGLSGRPSRSRSRSIRTTVSANTSRTPPRATARAAASPPSASSRSPTPRFTATASTRTASTRAAASSRPAGSRELVNSTITGNSAASSSRLRWRASRSTTPSSRPSTASSRPSTRSSRATPRTGRRTTARSATTTVHRQQHLRRRQLRLHRPGQQGEHRPAAVRAAQQRRADRHAELPAHQPGAGHGHRTRLSGHRPAQVSRGPSAAPATSAPSSWRRRPPSRAAPAGLTTDVGEHPRHAACNPLIAAGTAAFEFGTTDRLWRQRALGRHGHDHPRQAGATSGVAAQRQRGRERRPHRAGANTAYHYRLVVQNADGIALGADATFTHQPSRPEARGRRCRPRGVPRSCVRRAFTPARAREGGERHAAEGRAGHARRAHDQAHHAGAASPCG